MSRIAIPSYYSDGALLERKALAYYNDNNTYVVDGVFFDALIEESSRNQTYLDISRFLDTSSEQYP